MRHIEFSTSRYFRPAAALFEDAELQLWVASRDGSVYLRGRDGDVFAPQFSKTQVPSKVRSITQDTTGTLWFGGMQGLASLDRGKVRRYGREDGIDQTDLSVLCPFPGGRLIAGGAGGRIWLGNKLGFRLIAAPEVVGHQWISGFLPVTENEVWVSTLGSGLFLWNGKDWKGFGVNEGLPDPRLTCVLDDGRGNLWLGSLGGIIRVERKELLDGARGGEVNPHWLRLDHTDGMPSRECIGGFQPAGWRSRDDQLWFPTGAGLVRVRPDLVERNKVPPPVYLESVRINGVSHPWSAEPIITEPGTARLEFRFVGLNFSAPEKTTYRARLAGRDDSWRELGNQRVAAFEAVPPGKYSFEVMAVNGDGIRSLQPARVSLVVKPHFWETPWFYLTTGLFVLAVAAGAGWFGARTRMKARIQSLKIRHARESERARIARDLHDDLGASLTEISILAALAAEDAEKTELQPSLEQLSNKAKHVVSGLDEIVWAVNPREDTLRSLVDYLAAFAREFLDIARIPLRLDVTDDIPDLPLVAVKRHGVFLAAREALNNIVKHSEASLVSLHIRIRDHVLEIRIQDNGKGFELDYAAGGNGMGNLRTRMNEAGGDCRIETHRGQGTVVFLTLPLHESPKPGT
jgi:signal transduction histidine kinase